MIDLKEICWAAGFLEGEGTFGTTRNPSVVQAGQADREPIDRLHRLFGGSVVGPYKTASPRPQYRWQLHRGAIGVMMTLYPMLSEFRRLQIRECLERWKAAPGSRSAQQRAKIACPQGHPYDYTDVNGHRICRRCRNAGLKRWRQNRRLRPAA